MIRVTEVITQEMKKAGASITWLEERAIKSVEDYRIPLHPMPCSTGSDNWETGSRRRAVCRLRAVPSGLFQMSRWRMR